jgi:hypothetical protein
MKSLKVLEKQEKAKHKGSKRKEILKISAEVNKMAIKEQCKDPVKLRLGSLKR